MSHKNYTNAAEEVRLWILNDESLYNLACQHKRRAADRATAAANFISDLKELNVTATPSGANFTQSAVQRAMGSL